MDGNLPPCCCFSEGRRQAVKPGMLHGKIVLGDRQVKVMRRRGKSGRWLWLFIVWFRTFIT